VSEEWFDRGDIAEEDLFPGLAELMEGLLTPQMLSTPDVSNPEQVQALYVDTLTLELPVEIQPLREEAEKFRLGISPPTQWIETSVLPVWHKIRIKMEVDHGEPGNQALGS
jgi:hypothetical protein